MKNITNVFYEFLIALCCLMSSSALWAWEDMSMPRLHVEGLLKSEEYSYQSK